MRTRWIWFGGTIAILLSFAAWTYLRAQPRGVAEVPRSRQENRRTSASRSAASTSEARLVGSRTPSSRRNRVQPQVDPPFEQAAPSTSGTPDWPAGVPASLQPAEFEERFHAALRASRIEGASLEVDCERFPCLAEVVDTPLDKQSIERLQEAVREEFPDSEVLLTRITVVDGPAPSTRPRRELFTVVPNDEESRLAGVGRMTLRQQQVFSDFGGPPM